MSRPESRPSNWALLIVILIIAGMTACASVASKPTVIITSPPSGSQFREGDEIMIQSTATDNAGIERVELLVDGVVAQTTPSPSVQVSFTLVQIWKASEGAHILSVRAYNKAGALSEPAAISITVAPSIAQINTPAPSATASAFATPTQVATPGSDTCTNNAAFVADITIPDGMVIAPGQPFTKIWQLKNTGTCIWNNYQLVFITGDAMTSGTVVNVQSTAPGATVNISVPMTATTASGTRTGQWRMRAPNGAGFGTTVNVTIAVPGSVTPTRTATPTCAGTPLIASFTASTATIAPGATISISPGAAVTLTWGLVSNAERAEIDQGIGGVETPGTRVVNPIANTTYTLTAQCGTASAVRQVTVRIAPPAPSITAPSDGTIFRVLPRVATFTWNPVSFTGGVTYNIEIEMNTGTWQPRQTAASLGTSYTMPAFPGDNQGRWRVWATSITAGAGAKSEWRMFSFDTRASQYAATWINDDTSTSGITRVVITAASQTLTVRAFAKCTTGECDLGAVSKTLDTAIEPIVLTGFTGGHTLIITMNNNAGTSLKIIQTPANATYYFHK
ncbi:MAG: hypothetical protein HZC40_16480 [Chloroflexi bacterium]|nr:hypothetical protein [Chloroflexota bacterium]